MNLDYLIKMANQIAGFYESYADQAAAQKEMAEHLTRFWDTRMRLQIIDCVAQNKSAGLSPLAVEAVKQLQHPAPAAAQ